jgi:hypothetical protein
MPAERYRSAGVSGKGVTHDPPTELSGAVARENQRRPSIRALLARVSSNPYGNARTETYYSARQLVWPAVS